MTVGLLHEQACECMTPIPNETTVYASLTSRLTSGE